MIWFVVAFVICMLILRGVPEIPYPSTVDKVLQNLLIVMVCITAWVIIGGIVYAFLPTSVQVVSKTDLSNDSDVVLKNINSTEQYQYTDINGNLNLLEVAEKVSVVKSDQAPALVEFKELCDVKYWWLFACNIYYSDQESVYVFYTESGEIVSGDAEYVE